MASDRPSRGPRRRTTSQASTNIYTTRRSSTTTTTTSAGDANLPPAPDPPTQQLPPSSSHPQDPTTASHPRTTQGQTYHVPPTSTTTPLRSPSPIPTPPGAPVITPLDDSDIEDELKELVGMDRGYLRLGPRAPMPRQPGPGQGATTTTTDQPTEQDNSTSKMDSQLDSAMQYIMASRNRAAPAPVASRAERIEYPYNNGSGHHYQGYHHHHQHHYEDHHHLQNYRRAPRRKQLQLQYPDGRVEMRYLLQ